MKTAGTAIQQKVKAKWRYIFELKIRAIHYELYHRKWKHSAALVRTCASARKAALVGLTNPLPVS